MSKIKCTCNEDQEQIPSNEAVDFIVEQPNGTWVLKARYHKDCPIHGFERIEEDE